MDALCRFGVPIFFMITGYFIGKENNLSYKIKKQIPKLVKYYIVYEMIYMFYDFCMAIYYNKIFEFQNNLLLNLKLILIAPTMGHHLWYLINLILVLIVILIFNEFNKLKELFAVSVFLHVFSIIAANLYMLELNIPLYFIRNFIFLGLFYVLLGIFINNLEIHKITINKNIILLFSIFMCLSQIFERFIWRKAFGSIFGDYFFTTIFACIGIFVYILKTKIDNKYVNILSVYSMPIYFLHVLAMQILNQFGNNFFNLELIKKTIPGNVMFVVCVCVLSCFLYNISTKGIHKSKLIIKDKIQIITKKYRSTN